MTQCGIETHDSKATDIDPGPPGRRGPAPFDHRVRRHKPPIDFPGGHQAVQPGVNPENLESLVARAENTRAAVHQHEKLARRRDPQQQSRGDQKAARPAGRPSKPAPEPAAEPAPVPVITRHSKALPSWPRPRAPFADTFVRYLLRRTPTSLDIPRRGFRLFSSLGGVQCSSDSYSAQRRAQQKRRPHFRAAARREKERVRNVRCDPCAPFRGYRITCRTGLTRDSTAAVPTA